MIRILLVEDDPLIAEIIQYYLGNGGKYSVSWLRTGQEACALGKGEFDAILLDILLPDMNGISLCRRLRGHYRCPIIFISCLDNRDTIVQALEMGGDDFIVKPFDNKILEARIQANLRRVAMDKEEVPEAKLSLGGITLDPIMQTLCHGERCVELAAIEFRILSFLIKNAGEYFTAQELYRRIWGKDSYGDIRTVQVHIHNLRAKLERVGSPHSINSIRRRGYCFCLGG